MSAKSAIENSLAQHLPLFECMRAMWVRPGTLAAKVLLDRCEAMLAQARVVHEAEAEKKKPAPCPSLGEGFKAAEAKRISDVKTEKKKKRRSGMQQREGAPSVSWGGADTSPSGGGCGR